MRARLAQLDAFALDVADAETLSDELVGVDAANEHVAPARRGRQRDVLLLEPLERLCGDQRQRLPGRCPAVVVEVAVAVEPLAGERRALDRRGQSAFLGVT